jgi:hypothetical protein
MYLQISFWIISHHFSGIPLSWLLSLCPRYFVGGGGGGAEEKPWGVG